MATFTAHYISPNASDNRARGLFEFESAARLGSKANAHDARLHMLEMFGNAALSWEIVKIEHKRASKDHTDGQMQLDFRDPVKHKRKTKREYW